MKKNLLNLKKPEKKYPLYFLKIGVSTRLLIIFALMHFGTLICLFILSLAIYWKLILSILIVIHGFVVIQEYARLHSRSSIFQIEWISPTKAVLYSRSGEKNMATFLPSSLISRRMIILNFKTAKWFKTSVILLSDNVSQQDWRKIRVYLWSA